MIRLLFSSAGRRVELINCFRNAARLLNTEIEIVSIDMDTSWSPACQISDHAYGVPRCTDADFIPEVLRICALHKIDLIIPTIDTELLIYADNRTRFADCGTEILLSSKEFIKVSRDKKATASKLSQYGIRTPATWDFRTVLSGESKAVFPLIAKPVDGSCSAGITIVNDLEQLRQVDVDIDRYILQDVCVGREYTINSFYDRTGKCRACVPHYRRYVRDGEVCFGETIRIKAFREISDRLSEIFDGIWGSVCFQGFQGDNGEVTVFEINARFGGGYPLCDASGGTFARWVFQDLMNETPDYHDNWREGVRMLRYDAAVFTQTEGL